MTAVQAIEPEVEAVHRDLSPAALEFLHYVLEHPETGASVAPERDERDWLWRAPTQRWVTLLGTEMRAEVERVTLGLVHLVQSVPDRIFDGDPARISSFYRLGSPHLTATLLRPPNGVAEGFARCDLVNGADGLRCLEVNFGARMGGWRLSFWADAFLRDPGVCRFLDERGIEARYRDPLMEMLEHAIEQVLGLPEFSGDQVNVALATAVNDENASVISHAEPVLREFYQRTLARRGDGLSGHLAFAPYPDGFRALRGRLFHGPLPIHAVIEHTGEPTPQSVFRCFKAGKVALFNGPMAAILNDKRNVALLSEHRESDAFDAGERAFIARHVPWTRVVEATKTIWRGERASLPEVLLAEREELVIKPTMGAGSRGVSVGRYLGPRAWDAAVRRALVEPGRWIVQEWQPSRSYLYHSEDGPAVHDVVWGTFGFGERFGGCFLRMAPRGAEDARGLINMKTGYDGLVLEVA